MAEIFRIWKWTNQERFKLNKQHEIFDENVWIGDTGASHHATNSKDGMFDLRSASKMDRIEVGDGMSVKVEEIGTTLFISFSLITCLNVVVVLLVTIFR